MSARDSRSLVLARFRPFVESLEARELLSASATTREAFGTLPLSFEVNKGQTDAQVRFLSRGQGYSLFLTADEAVLSLKKPGGDSGHVLRMQLPGANSHPRVEGLAELPGTVNYFQGDDSAQWQTSIATYGKVAYRDVYPGIDVVYYGTRDQQLEYDFIVAPGVSPASIRLAFEGAERIDLDGQGNLILHTGGEQLVHQAPVIYQEIDGQRRTVAGHYVLEGANGVSFAVGTYDARLPLVIDPVLVYSGPLGGASAGTAIARDASGNTYVTGQTAAVGFPTTSGAFQTTHMGMGDAFVTKLNPSGSALIYSTYLGGGRLEVGTGIAVDASGNAFVTGYTQSTNYPTTVGVFQTARSGAGDAFLTKLNATGTALLYSTYLGGNSTDEAYAIALDQAGNAYLTGLTWSTNYPTTAGAFQVVNRGFQDVFVTKLNPSGSAVISSTLLGGTGTDIGYAIALDANGNVYVTGYTAGAFPTTVGAFQTTRPSGGAFVTRLNPTFTALGYSTYLAGTGGRVTGYGIALDGTGNAVVVGTTFDADFPTLGGYQSTLRGVADAFVTKLNAAGSGLVFSTFLGGSTADPMGTEEGFGVALDTAGNVYVTGETRSLDFPTAGSIPQSAYGGGVGDAFLTKLNSTGSALIYSTYLGGSLYETGTAIVLDPSGNAYVTGRTASANFPTTSEWIRPPIVSGAFVTKIGDIGPVTHLRVTASVSSVAAGTAFSITVSARDATGVINPSYRGTVAFTTSDPSGLLPPTYTFTAGDAGVHTFTGVRLYVAAPQTITARDTVTPAITGTVGVTVVPGALTYFYIYPGTEPSPPVRRGEFLLVYLLPFDANYNLITTYTGLVTMYTPDPLAVYSPSYTFTGTEGGLGYGYVAFGTTGTQEFYCWNVGITVVGYATYSVIAPDGAPSGGNPSLPPDGIAALLREEPTNAQFSVVEPAILIRRLLETPAAPITEGVRDAVPAAEWDVLSPMPSLAPIPDAGLSTGLLDTLVASLLTV